jgi:hypothetical protein
MPCSGDCCGAARRVHDSCKILAIKVLATRLEPAPPSCRLILCVSEKTPKELTMHAIALVTLVFHCLGTISLALGAAYNSCASRFRA